MKKGIIICFTLLLLFLSGCGKADEESSTSLAPTENTVTTKGNLFDPDYFTDLYQQIGSALGAGDEDFMSFKKLDFFFSSEGTVKEVFQYIHTKISRIENPQDIYKDYSYLAYRVITNPLSATEIKLHPTDQYFAPSKLHPEEADNYNYSKYREQMAFLTDLNLKELISRYAVGEPTAYALRAQPISANYEENFIENGIFLDCTDPHNIIQIDRMPFSATNDSMFDGFKYYYGIYPYYESYLSGEEMRDLQYDRFEWDNIIILMIRE